MTMSGAGRRRGQPAALLLAVLLIAASCSGDDDDTGASPSSTTTTSTTAAPATTTTALSGVELDPGRAAEGACPAVPARARPDAARPRYEMDVRVDLAGNTVSGTQIVTFTPDLAIDRLVFRLWANAPRTARAGAVLHVDGVAI